MAQNSPLGNLITPKHFVRFYEDDEALVKEVAQFISSGFIAGHGGIVIATQAHVQALERRLIASGCDMAAARQTGQFMALDAAETLSRFMIDGWPDERRFRDVVGGLIAAAEQRHSWVRAFGEMVALLWAEGQQDAAVQLERLWTLLCEAHALSLFCAYPIHYVQNEASSKYFMDICTEHSQVLLPERSNNLHSL
jgi:hypothetical protein